MNKDDFSFEEILDDLTKEYNFPILKTNDFGHRCPNCFLPIGAQVKVSGREIEIIESFLE